jgi:hypothetical protein
MLLLGRLLESDAASGQFFISLFHVVAHERNVRKCSNACFMPRWCEENHSGSTAWNAKLDPALSPAKRLIRQDLESEFLCVEIQRLALILYRNAHELDRFDHWNRLRHYRGVCNPIYTAIAFKNIVAQT